MRELTTIDLIKALPMSPELQHELITSYPTYDESKQFVVTKICWDAFNKLQDVLESYWREKITLEVAEGKRHIGETLVKEIRKEVEKDIEDRISGKKEDDTKLAAIRSHLENLIKSQ